MNLFCDNLMTESPARSDLVLFGGPSVRTGSSVPWVLSNRAGMGSAVFLCFVQRTKNLNLDQKVEAYMMTPGGFEPPLLG